MFVEELLSGLGSTAVCMTTMSEGLHALLSEETDKHNRVNFICTQKRQSNGPPSENITANRLPPPNLEDALKDYS